MRKLIFTTAMFVLSFQTIAFCQTDSVVLKNAVSKLKTLLTDRPVEKAYLQFDKPYYAAGDTIYFKAYVTYGERHELSKISGILYVDLINKDNTLMQSITLQLNNGTAQGDFALAYTSPKGTYRIRAYTQWMRNYGQDYFFDKSISVGSINNLANTVSTATAGQPSLQFFPEGGNLVDDIKSRLAFKAIGPDGSGEEVKGVVVDNNNNEVVKFASSHLGMGVFEIFPEEGKTYKAKLTYANGTQNIVPLPVADAKGIVLAVNNDDPDKIAIEVRANRAYYKENLNKDLNIILYWGGSVRTIKTKLDNEVLGLDMPKSNFRTGILQVTLLSQTGEPLSERLAFIQNQDLLSLSVNTDKPAYARAEKVHIKLNAKTNDNQAATGYFSVSVVDENKVPEDDNKENTILSDLLLTSDLKGYVEQPNYYFANVTSQTRANLDALMLTQGYRRFVWKQLLNDNPVANTYQPERYLDIAGTVTTKAGALVADKKVELLPVEGGSVLKQTTDAQGKFIFPQLVYLDDTKFLLKVETSTGSNQAQIKLNSSVPEPVISAMNSVEMQYNEKADMLASLSDNRKGGIETANNGPGKSIMLKSVDVKDTKTYKSSNIGGSGHADQVIKGDAIKNGATLSSALNGVAHGVLFSGDVPMPADGMGGTFSNTVEVPGTKTAASYNTSTASYGQTAMLVIVDGVEMGAGSGIDNISPSNVETVEILKGANASIYGVEGGQGVMVITTRQTMSAYTMSTEMSPGIFSIVPKGFYKAREFYSPQYENTSAVNQRSDQRSTIFWKPDLVTDGFGNTTFDFFNAASKGTYRVVIEGIDAKGNLGRCLYEYKVE